MSKYANRKDDNHNVIASEFKRLGCGVKDVHDLPNFVDIIICYKGQTVMVEFSEDWIGKGGKWACIETIEQANELVKKIG